MKGQDTMQPKYLVRFARFRQQAGVAQEADLGRLHYPEIQREIRKGTIGGIPYRETRGGGKWDTSHVKLFLHDAVVTVPLTRDGVKAAIRELRPQEAEQLDTLDAEIEETKARLRQLQSNRTAMLREAFTRGHVVTVQEVRAVVDARLSDVKARREAAV